MRFASATNVPIDRSKQEVERTLQRYGATEFVYGSRPDRAVVQFVLQRRQIRFTLPMPDLGSEQFQTTPKGRRRSQSQAVSDHAQECRRLWRALALAIKAKLEMVASGIATIDEEFLGYIVVPTGKTMAEWATPLLDEYLSGKTLPSLLPGGSS